MLRSLTSTATAAFGAALLCGCTPDGPAETALAVAPAPATVASAPPITLPVSINAVMVALVDHASEPLWLDAYAPPASEEGWREAEYNAYQMAVSGKLIQLAGNGPNDADWVVDPEWKAFADEMSTAGMYALGAAQTKDVKGLNDAGDKLVAACESCHKKFKPNLTSMGIYKSPNYPPR